MIRKFLYLADPTTEVNEYQLGKIIDFFDSLEHNLVFKFLADKDYRMLIIIPEASIPILDGKFGLPTYRPSLSMTSA